MVMRARHSLHLFLLISFIVFTVWSGTHPRDRLTWYLEVMPAFIGLIILVSTYQKFKLTDLAYQLIWLHALVLLVGGHYTYAEMPLFNWLRDAYALDRNYYDRVGHVFQGFVPAIIAREILLRRSPLQRGKWLFFIVVSICLAISALYELIEWRVAVSSGEAATAFLATQGDIWDTQWDMFLALAGAIASLLLLSHWHDRQLESLSAKSG